MYYSLYVHNVGMDEWTIKCVLLLMVALHGPHPPTLHSLASTHFIHPLPKSIDQSQIDLSTRVDNVVSTAPNIIA